jgi:hypothetical protein
MYVIKSRKLVVTTGFVGRGRPFNPAMPSPFWEALVAADPAAASTADPPPEILHSGVVFTFLTPNSPKTSVCTAFFALSLKKT